MAIGLNALWSGFAVAGPVPETTSPDKVVTVFLEALMERSKKGPS